MSVTGLTDEERRYRTGYMIALVGAVVVLGTVHIWQAPVAFFMAYVGAGVWFYTGRSAAAAAARPARRRAGAARPAAVRVRAPRPARPRRRPRAVRRTAARTTAAGRCGGPAAVPTDDRRIPPGRPARPTGRMRPRASAVPEGTPMLATYRKLLDLMTPRERRRFYVILGIIMFSGLAEMLSVASVLPFIAVLADPDILESNGRWRRSTGARFASREGFLIFLGSAVFAVVVLGLLFSTLTQYVIYRFTDMRAYTIGSRLLRGYLLPALHLVPEPPQRRPRRHRADRGRPAWSARRMLPAMLMLPQAVVACS